MALSTAMRPEPCWNAVYLPPLVDAVRAPLSSGCFQSGCCCLRRAARADRAGRAVVPGGDGEEDALVGGDLVDRGLQRVDTRGVGGAEAQVHHVGALGRGPVDARDDARVVASAGVAEDLAVEDLGAGRHALVRGVLGARARRDRRHVRAVPDAVLGVRRGREVLGADDLFLEVGVGGVDAGVQDGDLDALAVVPGLPRLRGADLLHGLVEAGLAHPVEPDAADSGGGRAGPVPLGRQGPPQLGGVPLGGLHRVGVEGLQGAAELGAARLAHLGLGRAGRALVGDDDLQAVPLCGAVGLLAQLGDVEQALVERAVGDQALGVRRYDVDVAVPLDGPHGYPLTALRGVERDGAPRAVEGDAVAGEQGDVVAYRHPHLVGRRSGRVGGVRVGLRRAGHARRECHGRGGGDGGYGRTPRGDWSLRFLYLSEQVSPSR